MRRNPPAGRCHVPGGEAIRPSRRRAIVRRAGCCLLLVWCLHVGVSKGCPGPDAALRVARTDLAPAIDGMLDDPVWQSATVISDFQQLYPEEGGQPTVRTEVLLLYTTEALYVGVRAHERRASVVATTLKRDNIDQLMQDDQFAMAIDSYNDGRNGYWFSTNALGVRVDGQFFDEGNRWEMNWDGVWSAQAQILEDGWSAEFEIPFSTMRFKVGTENVMGINLYRRVIGSNEHLFSPLIPLRYSSGTATVSIARKILFEGISGGHNLQVKPYVVAGLQKEDFSPGGGLNDEKDLGLDVRYGLTDNLTATLSLNTDFAQAEVDERQINLTRFSLFFPEKRDFFLENSGSFTFGLSEELDVFFSRRIGLSRDDSGNLVSVPILAGGKLTGKVGKADVGLLNVRTRSSGVAPAEDFSVARVKVGVLPRSYVGGIFTNRWSQTEADNRVLGTDLNIYLIGDIGVSAFTATSSGPGHHLKSASALHLALFRSGERASFQLALTDVGSAFDPAIGFVLRPGTRKWLAQGSLPWFATESSLRLIAPGIDMVYYEGHDGRLQSSSQRAQTNVQWQSEDGLTGFIERVFENLHDGFGIFPGVMIPAGRYTDYKAGLTAASKPGRKLSGTVTLSAGHLFGGMLLDFQSDLLWKVNRNLTFSQYYGTSAVDLKDQSFQTHVVRTRVNYSLSTSFSAASIVQYDNASDQLGINLRLNYIFREGTELFLVYDGISENPALRDPLRLGMPIKRSVLLKLTYLLEK